MLLSKAERADLRARDPRTSHVDDERERETISIGLVDDDTIPDRWISSLFLFFFFFF